MNIEICTMNQISQPAYILFDLGNVIANLDIPATYNALISLTHPNEKAFEAFRLESNLLERYETGVIDTDTFIEHILHFARPGTTAQQVSDGWNAMLIDIPLARLQWLATLRGKFQVGLFSNINELHLDWVYGYLDKQYGMTNFETYCFDQVFYSHHIGHRKPTLSSFNFVQKAIGLPAKEILFIDDLPENTQAAREAGFLAATHHQGSEIITSLDQYLSEYASI